MSLHSVPVHSVLVHSVPVHTVCLYIVCLYEHASIHSVPVRSMPVYIVCLYTHSVPIHSVPVHSVPMQLNDKSCTASSACVFCNCASLDRVVEGSGWLNDHQMMSAEVVGDDSMYICNSATSHKHLQLSSTQ